MFTLEKETVLKDYTALKKIAHLYIKHKKYEKALRTLFAACGVMYTCNQIYCDDEIEEYVKQIAGEVCQAPEKYAPGKKVMFYDGFGNDRRGLAVIYLKALLDAGYDIIYVTYEKLRHSIGEIRKLLDEKQMIYIRQYHFIDQMRELNRIAANSGASAVLLYMYPDDVVGVGVFSLYEGKLERYLINLTDHAFWIGKAALDYTIEYRSYGAIVSYEKRKIEKERIHMLPFYPHIRQEAFDGLAFDTVGKKMIFSGGSLYKTFGEDGLYYKMMEEILRMAPEVIFYYAGEGDTTRLNRLASKYPGRVFYSGERKDFYEVIKRCYLYISTYPYFGGLMTQYALAAGKLPITLNSEKTVGEQTAEVSDAWFFETKEEMLSAVKRYIVEPSYLREQEKKVRNSIISPDGFAKELHAILEVQRSSIPVRWKPLNTDGIQRVSLENMNREKYRGLFCRVRTPFLFLRFPMKFIGGLCYNITQYKTKGRQGWIFRK